MEDKDQYIIIAYLQGDLSEQEEKLLEERMSGEESLRKEYDRLKGLYSLMDSESDIEVPDGLESDFADVLQNEKDKMNSRQLWMTWGSRVAAAVALIAIGVFAGSYFSGSSEKDAQMLALEQEIKANRELILQSLNESSASQRFMGVNATSRIAEPDKEVVDALIRVMNTDDNTNVRLAAVRALEEVASNEYVKDALLESLINQGDPLVQVALIELLVELNEKRAIPAFERVIKSDTIIQTVKDEAYWGVMKLS